MTGNLKYSIVTVVLNRRAYIGKAIENVLAQGYANLEHIIIDGGSTDGTLEVIKAYPHLRWISEPDEGSVFALNKGLRLVTGDIFGWLNSDESYLPGTLEIVADYFDAHPEWDVISGASEFVDEDGGLIGRRRSHKFNLRREIIGFNYLAVPSSVFVRTGALRAVGSQVDTSLRHIYDHDLWIRLGMAHRMANVRECLSRFGIHPDSGLVRTPTASLQEVAKVRERYRDYLTFWDRTIGVAYYHLYMTLYLCLKWRGIVMRSRKSRAKT